MGIRRARGIVIDSNAVFARGVASVLADAGIETDVTGDVPDWIQGPGARVAVVGFSGAFGADVIRELRHARPDCAIVALIDEETPETYAAALRAGASSAVWRKAPAAAIPSVVDAALQGFSLLPVGVAHRLGCAADLSSLPGLSTSDAEMLRALARGESVTALSKERGYSEREMHRRLRKLYDRMGAANRAEAIVLAAQWHLLDAPLSDHGVDIRDLAKPDRLDE